MFFVLIRTLSILNIYLFSLNYGQNWCPCFRFWLNLGVKSGCPPLKSPTQLHTSSGWWAVPYGIRSNQTILIYPTSTFLHCLYYIFVLLQPSYIVYITSLSFSNLPILSMIYPYLSHSMSMFSKPRDGQTSSISVIRLYG